MKITRTKGWMMMKTIMTCHNDDACLARQHCEGAIRQHYLLDGAVIESFIEAHRSAPVDARSTRAQTRTEYVFRVFLMFFLTASNVCPVDP